MIERTLSFSTDTRLQAHVVVIGSGAGGSVAAEYLSGQGKDVLLIEEGPYVSESATDIATVRPKVWREGGTIPIMGNAKLVFAEGRCLGGSTMMNAGLITRPHPRILDEWRTRYGIPDVEEKALARDFDAIEKRLGVHVPATQDVAGRLFQKGADSLGFAGSVAPTSIQDTDRGENKNSMQTTYLRQALAQGARIITDTRVRTLRFKNDTAESIEATHTTKSGRLVSIVVDCKTVIVAAGAIQTPLLLRRSGYKKNIGNTLQFHPTLRIAAEFSEALYPYLNPMSSFQVKEWAPEISMGISMSAPPYVASHLALNWPKTKAALARTDAMAIFYVMTRGHGNGVVRNIPLWDRAYTARYSLTEQELRNLSAGYARLSRILFEAGARRLYPSIDGIAGIESEREAARYETGLLPVRSLNLMSVHSFSSCPMGDPARGAVDAYGKLHGAANVFVCDASILPNAPGTNPQGILMAMVLRNLRYYFK